MARSTSGRRTPRPPSPARKPRQKKPKTLVQVFGESEKLKRRQARREIRAALATARAAREYQARLAVQARRRPKTARTLLARVAAMGAPNSVPFLDEWQGSKLIVIAAGHLARFAAHQGGHALPPIPLPWMALPALC